MSASSYVVNVACDFGQGKINTGLEFAHRPQVLSDLVAVVEELYSAELRLQTGNENAEFHCAVLLLLVDVVGDGSERKGRWVEVLGVEQIGNGAQLFVFDSNSPPPSKGTIPKVQLVVTAEQVMRFRSSAARGGLTTNVQGQQQSRVSSYSRSLSPPQMPQTPHEARGRNAPRNGTTSGDGRGGSTADRGDGAHSFTFHAPPSTPSTHLSSEAREYLFQQLCRASGFQDSVSASRLHAILAENGLVLSTEQFTDVTNGEMALGRTQWRELEQSYPPLIDALYVRLAAKAAHRNGEDALQELKDKLQTLQDEEHRLLIRHATLREEMAKVTRDVREEEHRVKSLESNDRLKDWSMVQKFVSLKLRQNKLRREEDQINKELSLL